MPDKTVKLYVVTHKPTEHDYPKCYQIINVTTNADPRGLPCDEGENIAEKNPTFCELTALYWIWKNDKSSDYIGLEHYRRIFTECIASNSKAFFLKPGKIRKLLSRHDILTTKLYWSDRTFYQNRLEFCYEKDVILLGETVKEVAPDYYETYLEVMNGHRSFLCNMFVSSREVLDGYCQWLFQVLFALEKKIDTSGYQGNFKRIYGYMSEVLLTVYIFQNKLDYKECKVANLDNSFFQKLFNFLKRGRRK